MKSHKLNQVTNFLIKRKLQIFVILFALAGGIGLLLYVKAASLRVSVEAESASITSPATIIADSSASGGQAVRFNSPTVKKRDRYQWPLSRYSIWNMPIGSNAQYIPAGIAAPTQRTSLGNLWRVDNEFIGIDPNSPVKSLITPAGSFQVRVPSSLANNGAKNGCTALISATNPNYIYQGQWLVLSPGANPSWQYDYSIVKINNSQGDSVNNQVALNGPGMWGCHGGSALSGFAGAIKKGELDSVEPIHHALIYELSCYLYCSRNSVNAGKPYRWPAYRSDAYATAVGISPTGYKSDGKTPRWYNGANSELTMGSLLALKPDFNVASLGSPHARKIAQAMKDYGAYLADDAEQDVSQWAVEYGAAFSDGGTFEADLIKLVTAMQIVKNNGPTTIGGGGTPRACYAPAFSDIADGIPTNPNGNVSQPIGC